MRERHAVIGIIPSVLWILQLISLLAAERYAGKGFTLSSDAVTSVTSMCFIIVGFLSLTWIIVYHYMARSSRGFIKEGPYKLVRHPLHVSLYLILIGLALIFSSFLWIAILALFVPVWYKVCRMEEEWMLEVHGVGYLEYIYKTGMFFPK
jgi:protein-S-isoprenylcysteine O-methyltransferase Ste14